MTDPTDHLAERLHALADHVTAPSPDLDHIEVRAGRRWHRRRIARSTGVVAALLAASAVAVTVGTGDGGGTTRAAGGVDASYLISVDDTVVWYGEDGSVVTSATPQPETAVRAEPLVGGTAVAITVGTGQQQISRLTPGGGVETVAGPAEGAFSALWAAGQVEARPVVIGSPWALQSRLVALDLSSGEEWTVVDAGTGGSIDGLSTPADGRALVTWTAADDGCRTVVVDIATEDQQPTGLDDCGITRVVAPDGVTAVSVDLPGDAVVVDDVASGAEVARVPIDPALDSHAMRIDFDGRRVVLSHLTSDVHDVPGQVIDVETGTSVPLPGDGPATIWGDVGG